MAINLSESAKTLVTTMQFGESCLTKDRKEAAEALNSRTLKSVTKTISSLLSKEVLLIRPLVDPAALEQYEVTTLLQLRSTLKARELEELILSHPSVVECSILGSQSAVSVLFRVRSNHELSRFYSFMRQSGTQIIARSSAVVSEKWLYSRSYLNPRARRECTQVFTESEEKQETTLRSTEKEILATLLPTLENSLLGLCRALGISRRVLPRILTELKRCGALRGFAYELDTIRSGGVSQELTLSLNNPCEETKLALLKYASLSRYITELTFTTGAFDAQITVEGDEAKCCADALVDLGKILGDNLREVTASQRVTRSFRTLESQVRMQSEFKAAA